MNKQEAYKLMRGGKKITPNNEHKNLYFFIKKGVTTLIYSSDGAFYTLTQFMDINFLRNVNFTEYKI